MLNLTDILEWGYFDIKELNTRMEQASTWDICNTDIIDYIEGINGDKTDINTWIYSTINLTFYKVIEALREHIVDTMDAEDERLQDIEYYIDKLEDEFSPYINYMDSWYSNILDNIDLDNKRDRILDDLLYEIKQDI